MQGRARDWDLQSGLQGSRFVGQTGQVARGDDFGLVWDLNVQPRAAVREMNWLGRSGGIVRPSAAPTGLNATLKLNERRSGCSGQ